MAAEKELARLRSETMTVAEYREKLTAKLEAARAVLLRAPERYAGRFPMERSAAVAFIREMMTGPLEVLAEELRLAKGDEASAETPGGEP